MSPIHTSSTLIPNMTFTQQPNLLPSIQPIIGPTEIHTRSTLKNDIKFPHQPPTFPFIHLINEPNEIHIPNTITQCPISTPTQPPTTWLSFLSMTITVPPFPVGPSTNLEDKVLSQEGMDKPKTSRPIWNREKLIRFRDFI